LANLLDILIIFIALLNLVVTTVMAKKSNYVYTHKLAYVLGGFYGTMFVAATGIQIWYIIAGIA